MWLTVPKKPKVTRLATAATTAGEEDEADQEHNNSLIDVSAIHDAFEAPFTLKYWRPSDDDNDCFAKMPFILKNISRNTGAELFLDTDNKRIRISSLYPLQADEAWEQLTKLEAPLVRSASIFPPS